MVSQFYATLDPYIEASKTRTFKECFSAEGSTPSLEDEETSSQGHAETKEHKCPHCGSLDIQDKTTDYDINFCRDCCQSW